MTSSQNKQLIEHLINKPHKSNSEQRLKICLQYHAYDAHDVSSGLGIFFEIFPVPLDFSFLPQVVSCILLLLLTKIKHTYLNILHTLLSCENTNQYEKSSQFGSKLGLLEYIQNKVKNSELSTIPFRT